MLVGVLGGGQLGRMLALAGTPLGMRFRFLDPAEEAPVDALGERIRAAYDDRDALERFARGLDVGTYEFENPPVESARFLEAQGVRLAPPARALEVAQDRLVEKEFLNAHDVPMAPFARVDDARDLERGVGSIGLPAVLKTRRLGYDGKGQRVLRTGSDVAGAREALDGTPMILEGFVPFERELSLIAVRAQDGEVRCYPLIENHHREGMLRLSLAPAANLSDALQSEAQAKAARLLEGLDYVGVLAMEWFEHEGALLANEIAPRVHNSGHWTIEGAATSQFENHLRAVVGLPLGDTRAVGASVMVNLIGSVPPLDALLMVPDAHVHLYGKSPRPGRKVGHVTVCAHDYATLAERLDALRAAGADVPLEETSSVLRRR